MLDVLAGGAFLGFVVLVLAACRIRGERRRAVVGLLLAYTAALSFGAGLAQRDAWPFSAWSLAARRLEESVTYDVLLAADAAGREHDVDYRAWRPLGFDELLSWIPQEMPKLDPAARARVAKGLLARAERCRQEARRGEGCVRDRLGPLTAPDFLLHPRLWSRPEAVPAQPFVRVKLYRETLPLAAPGGRTRVLSWEFPP